ncbi:hypothetical protein ACT691_02490 [Vibrio metschnikovii]
MTYPKSGQTLTLEKIVALSWQIVLNSDAQDEEILAVFEFIRDEGEVYLFSANQCTPALLDELQQKGMHNLETFSSLWLTTGSFV